MRNNKNTIIFLEEGQSSEQHAALRGIWHWLGVDGSRNYDYAAILGQQQCPYIVTVKCRISFGRNPIGSQQGRPWSHCVGCRGVIDGESEAHAIRWLGRETHSYSCHIILHNSTGDAESKHNKIITIKEVKQRR